MAGQRQGWSCLHRPDIVRTFTASFDVVVWEPDVGATVIMANPIYLQLYTLRDDAAADLHSTFVAVAEAVYAGFAVAGWYDLKPSAFLSAFSAWALYVLGPPSASADLFAYVSGANRS